MIARWKLIPSHFKNNISLTEQDIYWINFNIKVCKDKTMKYFLKNKQRGFCAWCKKPLNKDCVIHHINYTHKCKKIELQCKSCGDKINCAKNLALIHSECNKMINEIQLYLCDKEKILKQLKQQKTPEEAYKYLAYLIPTKTKIIDLWMLCGWVIIINLIDPTKYEIIPLSQLKLYNNNAWKLFYRFTNAKYLKNMNQDWLKPWLTLLNKNLSAW